jgi:hypothetical protein
MRGVSAMKLQKIFFPIYVAFGVLAGEAAAAQLPSSVDNSKLKYMRPVFDHLGHGCGLAAGIGYTFTYEINALRDLDAKDSNNQYSYVYPYDFLDNGLNNVWVDDFTLGFEMVKTNGIPSSTDMGGFTNGYPTKWPNGYDIYFRGMQNRISDYFTIDLRTPEGLDSAKQWLHDHANGSPQGGLLNFSIFCDGVQYEILAIGTPEGGKHLISSFGTVNNHSMTIVGYNDSIRYDYNGDKKYTNDIDINEDGKIDIQDWEIGAFKIVNSWGPSAANSDSGFYYAPYSLFATPADQNGIRCDNKVFGMHVIKCHSPKLTLRVTITDSIRNNIKITAGVSENLEATAPDKIKTFGGMFNYSGGAYPMEGEHRSATLEFGLDVTELYDSIGGRPGKYFLIVESKAATGGIVDSVALMDYMKDVVRIYPSDQKAVVIAPNSTLNLGIVGNRSPVIKSTLAAREYLAFKASPNPVSSAEKVRFTLPSSNAEKASLSIVTASGKVVFHATYDKRDFSRIAWNLKSPSRTPIAKGVYRAGLSLRSHSGAAQEYSTLIFVK